MNGAELNATTVKCPSELNQSLLKEESALGAYSAIKLKRLVPKIGKVSGRRN